MNNRRIDLTKSVYELCEENPDIIKILAEAGFSEITNSAMRAMAGRFMTIPKGARMMSASMDDIKRLFERNGYEV